jgi:predicted nucleic acid-binding protein
VLTVLVIDTSYLLELYKVPDYFDPAAHLEVKARFERTLGGNHRLYVPFPAVFEVANHIVDGRDGSARGVLAQKFVADVLKSYEQTVPFIITPHVDEESLKTLLRVFSGEFAVQRIGLTDASIIAEARRLKSKHGSGARVHIWTKDVRLKAHEPDHEADAFVG